jgi:hypothetical protein
VVLAIPSLGRVDTRQRGSTSTPVLQTLQETTGEVRVSDEEIKRKLKAIHSDVMWLNIMIAVILFCGLSGCFK